VGVSVVVGVKVGVTDGVKVGVTVGVAVTEGVGGKLPLPTDAPAPAATLD